MKKQIYWEDVNTGQEIPTLTKIATTMMLVKWAGAFGDYNPLHFEHDFAVNFMRSPGIIVHGTLKRQMLIQMVTDWIGVDGWLAKHRRYAREEAGAFLAADTGTGLRLRPLLAGPALARRRALKHLSYHLPARPALRFLYQYVLRGGFLDGAPGLNYCRLLARYESMAGQEIKRQRAVLSGPTSP